MIDHVGLFLRDYQSGKAFYQEMLRPLGYELLGEVTPESQQDSTAPPRVGTPGAIAMFGPPGAGKPFQITQSFGACAPTHVALRCSSREVVDAVYRAGLKAGGRDNGAPGPRKFMPENYYGAFVLDLEGNEIEPLCWLPEAAGATNVHDLARNKELVVRFYRTIETRGTSRNALDEFVAEDFVNYGVPPGFATDREGLKDFFDTLRKGFPDGQSEFLHVVAEGDMVIAHKVNCGTHLGEFMGVPATGRKVRTESVKMFRVKDGKIVAHWHVVDVLGMLAQLGVGPGIPQS